MASCLDPVEAEELKMADDGGSQFNTFNNDGSFLERFKKLQKEKLELERSSKPVTPPAAPPLKKFKPIVMKTSAMKKKLPIVHKGNTERAFIQGASSEREVDEDSKTGVDSELKFLVVATLYMIN